MKHVTNEITKPAKKSNQTHPMRRTDKRGANGLNSKPSNPNATEGGHGIRLNKDTYRWGLALPLAVIMTVSLGVTMASLIAVEFEPQDKGQALQASINPVVADIKVLSHIEPPKRQDDIVIPPSPPTVDSTKADRPSSKPIIEDVPNIIFNPVDYKIARTTHVKIDSPYQPILRNPPTMPDRAQRSGHCKVRFDVSTQGQPFNVAVTSCSEELFARATVKAVQKWKYRPKTKDGQAITVQDVKNIVRFNLTDERGRIISE
ncbi:MAG: TonB family protein [Litorimonas sp.]